MDKDRQRFFKKNQSEHFFKYNIQSYTCKYCQLMIVTHKNDFFTILCLFDHWDAVRVGVPVFMRGNTCFLGWGGRLGQT